MKEAGWSAENIVFGMGAGLLQKINRDTQRFAFKCSAQVRNGETFEIYKKPKDISKMSKKGYQYLYRIEGAHGCTYKTTNHPDPTKENVLVPVFKNGDLLVDYDFETVRNNAKI